MRMYDIIAKKRDGGTLNREELSFAVNGYVAGDVPDYQMSALLMAIYLRGMTDEETAVLTDVMARSGDMVDLSAIAGIKADKHSTGGVGDKTTLVIAPIVAACGVKIAKMSGRGLGHTGGTIDKMEAVPGTRTSLTQEEFFKQVNEIGISVIGQSGKIAAADKKIYALRGKHLAALFKSGAVGDDALSQLAAGRHIALARQHQHIASQLQAYLGQIGRAPALQDGHALGYFKRVADVFAQGLIHIGNERRDLATVRRADCDHLARQLKGAVQILHEGAVPHRHIEQNGV